MNGFVDDFRFYDTILNDQEIYKLFSNETKVGPLVHYTFEEGPTANVVQDLGTQGANLMLKGAVITTSNTGIVNGNIILLESNYVVGNYGLSLNGSSDYARAQFAGVQGSNPRTISLWFKRLNTSNISSNWDYLVDYGDAADEKRFSIALTHDNVMIVVSMKTSDSAGLGGLVYGSSIQDTRWHHLAVLLLPTYSRSDGIRIYLDGEDDTRSTLHTHSNIITTKTTNSVEDWLTIGGAANATPATGNFAGHIDDFRMYNVALTEDEIRMLYYNSDNTRRIDLS